MKTEKREKSKLDFDDFLEFCKKQDICNENLVD